MLDYFFSPQGRMSRGQFWLASLGIFLAVFVAIFLLSLLAAKASANHGSLRASGMALPVLGLGAIIALLAVWANCSISIKRYHDRGKSGWWMLISLVPFIGGAWYIIEVGCLSGTDGPNAYGHDPRGGSLHHAVSHF